jgi:hypothetical protein
MSRFWVFGLLAGFSVVSGACDRRTPEERGKDYAKEKLGFVEGASKVLEEKGKSLGQSVGKGVGDTVKGTGSGVKDALYSPVRVVLDAPLAQKVNVLKASERNASGETRTIAATIAFSQRFEGRLQLHALGNDSVELGRAEPAENFSQVAGSQREVSFEFPAGTRLSKVETYVLFTTPPKVVALDATLANSGIALSQLKEQGTDVSVYAIFKKPFTGTLELRAKNAEGNEVGRSARLEKLKQETDSATFFTFKFDPRAPLASVTEFTLHSVAAQR